jgi:hypothetical protein
MNAELAPRRLRQVDVVVLRRLRDIRKSQRPVGVGNAGDLIEPGDGVANVARVGQRLLALLRKGKTLSGRSLCAVSCPCFSWGVQVACMRISLLPLTAR